MPSAMMLAATLMGWGALATADTGAVLPRLEPGECFIDVPADRHVDCGYLVVRETRDNPRSRALRLPYAVIRSRSPEPRRDPVFFSTGGPGGSSVSDAGGWWHAIFHEHRDFVVLEHRGSTLAEPVLDCPEVKNLAFDPNLSPSQSADRIAKAARLCRDRLRAEGADLSAYNSAAIAADMDDLRRLLGIRRWNLLGVSYGARLMLTYLREYPEAVRSVVLDSPLPPDVNWFETAIPEQVRVLEKVFAECRAQPACHGAYPQLAEHFYELVRRLNLEPVSVMVSRAGETYSVVVDGNLFALSVLDALADASFLPIVPYLISKAFRGEYAILAPILPHDSKSNLALGARYSIMCWEQLPSHDPKTIARQTEGLVGLESLPAVFAVPEICRTWNDRHARPDEFKPVVSDVPALILSGSHDSITPASWGKHLARTLTRSHTWSFPGMCHGIIWSDDSVRRMVAAFLDAPERQPDTACATELQVPLYATDTEAAGAESAAPARGQYRIPNLQRAARTLRKFGLTREAIEVLDFANSAFPDTSAIQTELGETFLGMALSHYEKAMRLDERNDRALDSIHWIIQGFEAQYRDVHLTESEKQRMVGSYGPRRIMCEQGVLYYQRTGQPRFRLLPLSKDTFALDGVDTFRLRIVLNDDHVPIKLIGLYDDGRRDESPRDGEPKRP